MPTRRRCGAWAPTRSLPTACCTATRCPTPRSCARSTPGPSRPETQSARPRPGAELRGGVEFPGMQPRPIDEGECVLGGTGELTPFIGIPRRGLSDRHVDDQAEHEPTPAPEL